MLPAPKGLFVILLVVGSIVTILFLRYRYPTKKFKRLTSLFLGIIIVLFVVFLIGAYKTSSNHYCKNSQETTGSSPTDLAPEFHFQKANEEYDQGNCTAAIGGYSKVIKLNPNFAEAYNNRAYTYMMLEDYKNALPDLDRAIALRPNYINALMNRGDIYNFYYNVDKAKAMEDYDRVYELDPTHGSICGHRMLARNNGWTLGAYWELLTKGTKAGCS